MAAEKGTEKSAVQKLRDKYFERRRNRIPPSEKIKEAFRKDKERSERKNEPEKKIARPSDRPNEADI